MMSRGSAKRLALLLFLTIARQAVARAEPSMSEKAAADGNRRFARGDYAGALADYQRAYFFEEAPAYLFDIAECHARLRQRRDAVRYYRMYLAQLPDAPNRRMVEQKIAALDPGGPTLDRPNLETLSEPHPLSPALEAGTPPAMPYLPEPEVRSRWWIWPVLIAAAGVAAAVTVAATAHDSFRPTLPEFGPGRREAPVR
jgi:hypothetical protein